MPNDFQPDPEIRCRDFRIGCIGAGFIMNDVQLAAYHQSGFPVVAIASRTPGHARRAAERWSIPRTHDHPFELIEDRNVQIVDIAFPPDLAAGTGPACAPSAARAGYPCAETARAGLMNPQKHWFGRRTDTR